MHKIASKRWSKTGQNGSERTKIVDTKFEKVIFGSPLFVAQKFNVFSFALDRRRRLLLFSGPLARLDQVGAINGRLGTLQQQQQRPGRKTINRI